MIRRALVVCCFASTVAAAPAAPAPKELVDAAKSAAGAEQYCRSHDLFLEAFRRDPQAKYLYNAAEVALAADDRTSALALYGQVQKDFPTFDAIDDVRARFAELATSLATGPGTPCPAAAVSCGDFIVGGAEACDDGNIVDGDGCDHDCAVPAVVVVPPAPPTAPPAKQEAEVPVAGIAIGVVGGIAFVGGGVATTLGALSWLDYASSRDRLAALEKNALGGDDSAVDDARDESKRQSAAGEAWDDSGRTAFIVGVSSVAVGVTALVVAGVLVVGAGPDEADSDQAGP